MTTQNQGRCWYALYVRPRHEKSVAQALQAKGYEELLPVYKKRSRWSDRVKEIEVPLFARYTFCRFDLRERLAVLKVPGVQTIVSFARMPAPVDDGEISSIRTIVDSGLYATPAPFLREGQRVQLHAGPLAGAQGILVRSEDSNRLVVSVSLLQRSVTVSIDPDWVAPEDDAAPLLVRAGQKMRPERVPVC